MQRALLLVLALLLGQPASAGQVAAVRQAAAPLGSAAGLAGTWRLSGAPTLQTGLPGLAAPSLTGRTPVPRLAATAIPAVAAPAAPPAAQPTAQGPAVAPAAPRLVDDLPATMAADLKVDRDSPALERYLELLKRLRKVWGKAPFENEELMDAQRAVAVEAGLNLEVHPDIIEISPEGGHWLNRWVKSLQESKGVRLYWSPLHNHYEGYGAAYNRAGYIVSDEIAPLLDKLDPQLFHEFLHAYVDRGRHAKEFEPLRTSFISWWSSFPRRKGREAAGYSGRFQADEILTNLHTAFDRARRVVRLYGPGRAGWTSSSYEQAPFEVRQLVDGLDNPIFLAESTREMAAGLLAGVLEAAGRGLQGQALKKDYGNLSGAIPYVGEYEANEKKDSGFYRGRIGDIEAGYLTIARLKEADPENTITFPVLFSRDGYAVQIELSLPKVAGLDLSDPKIQEAIVVSAARLAVPKLAHLQQVTKDLTADIEGLKALQEQARQHADVALVERIQRAAKAAFLKTAFYFIRQDARPQA